MWHHCSHSYSNLSPAGSTGPTLPLVPSAVLASGSEVTGVRGQNDSGCAVAEAVGVTAGHVGFSSGKEMASPASRPPHSDPQAPDSESIIVAMERVSVLFDRYSNTHTHANFIIHNLHRFLMKTEAYTLHDTLQLYSYSFSILTS